VKTASTSKPQINATIRKSSLIQKLTAKSRQKVVVTYFPRQDKAAMKPKKLKRYQQQAKEANNVR
jgi:hypothetical protein